METREIVKRDETPFPDVIWYSSSGRWTHGSPHFSLFIRREEPPRNRTLRRVSPRDRRTSDLYFRLISISLGAMQTCGPPIILSFIRRE